MHRIRPHLRKKHGVAEDDLPPLRGNCQATRLRKVQVNAERHTCSLCGESYWCADSLRIHMRTHTNPRPLAIRTVHSHPYHCDLCDTRYMTRSGLSHHISVTHPAHSVGYYDAPSGEREEVRIAVKRFRCEICNAALATASTLAVHMREKHGASFEKERADFRPASEETPEHLLRCPALDSLRSSFEFAVKDLDLHDTYTHRSLPQFLCALFGYPNPLLSDATASP